MAAIFAACFAAIGLILNWRAIVLQMRASKAQKQVDVIMECNRGYESASARIRQIISDNRREGTAQNGLERALDEPLRSYWLVYYEEWQFFSIGMVPKSFFKFWCAGLVRNLAAPSLEGFDDIDLWETWLRFGASSWGYTGPFVDHINQLKKISELVENRRNVELDKVIKTAWAHGKSHHNELGS